MCVAIAKLRVPNGLLDRACSDNGLIRYHFECTVPLYALLCCVRKVGGVVKLMCVSVGWLRWFGYGWLRSINILSSSK